MDLSQKMTKILCTIGPASSEIKILRKMYNNGMDAVRLNTAHGDFSQYKQIIEKVRKIDDIPVVLDIKGPELRLRCREKHLIAKNSKTKIGVNDRFDIWLNHNVLTKIKKGDKILVEDGKYQFKVVSKSKDHFIMKSKENSIIEPNKNINIPNKSLDLPFLTANDKKAINFAIKNKIEYIALSFCRSKKDVLNLRRKLDNTGIKIIAKIENREGIENIDEIIKAADGIMVARGDLGVELPPEEVPLIQKRIIKECDERGKLVIVATQMLESMISNPTPTRAEISDIANAVLDGTDCIMLSEETAIGRYPAEAVKYMTKVSIQVEPEAHINITQCDPDNISSCISTSIYSLAKTLPVTKIVCLTSSGYTASMIARFRLNIQVIAITASEMVGRQLALYYSIRPVHYKTSFWHSPVIKTLEYLYKIKMIEKNDLIIFTAGLHTLERRKTNAVEIHSVRDILNFSRKREKFAN